VIFRALYRRKFKCAFGQFLTDEQIEKTIGGMSEWTCCQLVLPERLVRLFVSPKMTEAEALTRLSCTITHVLRTTNNKADEK